jgi:hypothetical protein
MCPDNEPTNNKSKSKEDFKVFDNIKEALESGADPTLVFNQWKKANLTASLIVLPKLSEVMDIWQQYDVPVTVVLFFLKSMEHTIVEQTKKGLPSEALPDFDKALEELDLLVDIYDNLLNKEMKPLREMLEQKKADQKAKETFELLYR